LGRGVSDRHAVILAAARHACSGEGGQVPADSHALIWHPFASAALHALREERCQGRRRTLRHGLACADADRIRLEHGPRLPACTYPSVNWTRLDRLRNCPGAPDLSAFQPPPRNVRTLLASGTSPFLSKSSSALRAVFIASSYR